MIENQVDIKNEEEVINALNKLNIGFDSNYRVYLDSQDITEDIRKEKVVKFVSEVSAISSVRRKMVDLQRDIAKEGNYILDGRDAGMQRLALRLKDQSYIPHRILHRHLPHTLYMSL